MRFRVLGMVAAAMNIWAAQPPDLADRSVTVCQEGGPETWSTASARAEAAKIFAEVGVRIQWRIGFQECADKHEISIHMSYETPKTEHPDDWAYAYPYDGVHIVVFYDRIKNKMGGARASHLLAYVLAHEITHVVQGVARHSESGIMKAAWNTNDYFDMGQDRLHFSDLDVILLYRGLEARQTLLAAGLQ